ncbi:MAG: hypothetical protein QNK11_07450 [Legionella sp.]|nr:hypothetical protein [Legionella sp.]
MEQAEDLLKYCKFIKNIVHLQSEQKGINMDVFEVKLSTKAENDLRKIPSYIVFKLQVWVDGVRKYGLREMRKRTGFHDEPLKGDRKKQRSIRLNKAYRAFYVTNENGTIHFIEIIEVNKHDY